MTLAQVRIYLDAAEDESARAFKLSIQAARLAWADQQTIAPLLKSLPD